MSNSSTEALEARITELAANVVAEHGAVIYDVEVHLSGGSGVVRLFVDREAEGEGITIGEVTSIAKQVGYLLDVEDVVPSRYDFEVSSPGIERPLRKEGHYLRNIGRDVRLVLDDPLSDGRKVVEGRLESVSGGVATIVGTAGDETHVSVENVRRGRTVFDFGAPQGKGT